MFLLQNKLLLLLVLLLLVLLLLLLLLPHHPLILLMSVLLLLLPCQPSLVNWTLEELQECGGQGSVEMVDSVENTECPVTNGEMGTETVGTIGYQDNTCPVDGRLGWWSRQQVDLPLTYK